MDTKWCAADKEFVVMAGADTKATVTIRSEELVDITLGGGKK